MNGNEKGNQREKLRFTIIRSEQVAAPPVLLNLLRDTSPPLLAYLAEQYGLPRIPGLTQQALIERLLGHLSPEDSQQLENRLIAARFGALTVAELLEMALALGQQARPHVHQPRLDDMPAEAVTLIENGPPCWVFTMHGHDASIDLEERSLSCDCEYFRFAAHRQALCKHLARALTLMPPAYAREVLIDLLVSREYGGPDTPRWEFEHRQAA
jgi:hypothetical protein